jgi:hypothetical protein
MAIYKNGINGAFSGKLGTVVGATWKGQPYMRTLPSKRKGPASEAAIASRNKFAMAHNWLKPVLPFVREGFKGYSATTEGFLAAKSYLLRNAFEGSSDKPVINPALVKVSYGDLLLPENITAVKIEDNQIQFTWDTTDLNKNNRFDQVMMLAYDIENGTAYYQVPGQPRLNGGDVLPISQAPFDRIFHLYVAFVAADRSRQSESLYLGTI